MMIELTKTLCVAISAIILALLFQLQPVFAASNKTSQAIIDKKVDAAAIAYQAGRYDDATKLFREVVKLDPKHVQAWHFLGQSLAKTNDIEGARQAYEKVLKLQPSGKLADRTQEQLNYLAKMLQPGAVFQDCPDCPYMVVLPAGSFSMGSSSGDDAPTHNVNIVKPFAMGKTEVTQAQWQAIMGNNPSRFKNCGDNCPVETVSWDDTKQFIQKLNAKTGKRYRLPTEAEWEYACRAGGHHEYCGSDDINSVAWYGAYASDYGRPAGNSAKTTNPVATKQANGFGLYDMSGNVWEWVEDSYHDNYSGAPTDGTVWQGDGAKRVLRGGSWDAPRLARPAERLGLEPATLDSCIGFRLARMLP